MNATGRGTRTNTVATPYHGTWRGTDDEVFAFNPTDSRNGRSDYDWARDKRQEADERRQAEQARNSQNAQTRSFTISSSNPAPEYKKPLYQKPRDLKEWNAVVDRYQLYRPKEIPPELIPYLPPGSPLIPKKSNPAGPIESTTPVASKRPRPNTAQPRTNLPAATTQPPLQAQGRPRPSVPAATAQRPAGLSVVQHANLARLLARNNPAFQGRVGRGNFSNEAAAQTFLRGNPRLAAAALRLPAAQRPGVAQGGPAARRTRHA